ncbi:MAG: hypothetical protein JOZ44_11810 [Acidobacteria bacterium]|nr:hypothetical protein [Acidobacteriota bacterium]
MLKFMRLLSISLVGLLPLLSLAQTTVDTKTPNKEIQAIIDSQFGSQFVLAQGFPVLTGDFNGDGSEDVLLVVTSRDSIQVANERYHVLDPSSEYFGYEDPKITSQFASQYPGDPRYVLIIHGEGKDGWHAKEPKDRFVLINMTFDKLSIGHVLKKKKVFDDINLQETGVLNSFLYWNGKRYKWQPGAEL